MDFTQRKHALTHIVRQYALTGEDMEVIAANLRNELETAIIDVATTGTGTNNNAFASLESQLNYAKAQLNKIDYFCADTSIKELLKEPYVLMVERITKQLQGHH